MSVRTKNILFALFLLVIMLGLGAWYFFARPAPKLPVVPTSNSPVAGNQAKPDFSANPLHIIEHGQYYDADLQYPSATPLAKSASASADTTAVLAMKTFAQTTLATFKKDGRFDTLTPADAQIQGLDQGQKYAISDGYTPYSGSHTISYVFNIYEDTLGAHPNTYFHTFTFDAQSGQSLALSDLFTPGVDYLTQLSTLSRAALTKQQGSAADQTSINSGTTPTNDNFQNFAIDGSNLMIVFPPYQVGPYSIGTQTIYIPLSQLKSLLKPEYQ
jgi:hypothetical protein